MEEIIKKAKDFAQAEIDKYSYPSHINFETSLKEGQRLAEALNANKDIVALGTMLMDIKLGEAIAKNVVGKHVEMSVEVAKNFLSQFELSDEILSKIINCVEEHHGTVAFSCIESEICANADCYRFLFPKNVFAFIADNVKKDMSYDGAIDFANKKLEEKHKILSLDMCKNELEPHYQAFKKLFEASLR